MNQPAKVELHDRLMSDEESRQHRDTMEFLCEMQGPGAVTEYIRDKQLPFADCEDCGRAPTDGVICLLCEQFLTRDRDLDEERTPF